MSITHAKISVGAYGWRVRLAALGKDKEHVGWYNTREEAAIAQDEAAAAHGLIKIWNKDKTKFRYFTQAALDKQNKVAEAKRKVKPDIKKPRAEFKPLTELKGTPFYGL